MAIPVFKALGAAWKAAPAPIKKAIIEAGVEGVSTGVSAFTAMKKLGKETETRTDISKRDRELERDKAQVAQEQRNRELIINSLSSVRSPAQLVATLIGLATTKPKKSIREEDESISKSKPTEEE